MLVQSVGCEDADTSKIADKSASLFVLNLLSSEVLCFESTPAEQIQFRVTWTLYKRFTQCETSRTSAPVSGAAC